MKDYEKEFYAHLGLLSVSFAKMEYKLSVILIKLIQGDEALISITIIENNNLNQNIELLKKINRFRGFETKSVNNLIELIGRVKTNRNLFIHGIWGNPVESENDTKIICDERKIRYSEDKNGKMWRYNQIHTFRLSYIKKEILTIKDIITAQDYLIKKLEDKVF